MKKIILFLKKYWREAAILMMFAVLQSGISEAKKNAEYAYDTASEASSYAQEARDNAADASDEARDASNYAAEAADQCSQ